MHAQDTNLALGSRTAGPAAMPGSWRDAYPILLGCLSEGRSPSDEETELLVARMAREIGTGEGSVWSRSGAASVRRRMLLAAARAALVGQRDPHSPYSRFPLVLRGH